ncbi:MAG: DNA-processing protein DprA, partial [Myxococcota bacterium]|nr:DNA-processing protein DprA [Myxococcota bacterium]
MTRQRESQRRGQEEFTKSCEVYEHGEVSELLLERFTWSLLTQQTRRQLTHRVPTDVCRHDTQTLSAATLEPSSAEVIWLQQRDHLRASGHPTPSTLRARWMRAYQQLIQNQITLVIPALREGSGVVSPRLGEGLLRATSPLPEGRRVAIIGARAADRVARKQAAEIAAEAARRGFIVVSGGARGIDAAAREGALSVGGQVITVIGAGLGWHLTHNGAPLTGEILVSPFPCDQRPAPWTFLRRNPWIAALSQRLLVVQAGVKSGALHAARWALRRRLPVYIVPGSMGAPLHQGAHQLCWEGARPLLSETQWLEDDPQRTFTFARKREGSKRVEQGVKRVGQHKRERHEVERPHQGELPISSCSGEETHAPEKSVSYLKAGGPSKKEKLSGVEAALWSVSSTTPRPLGELALAASLPFGAAATA